MPRQPKSKSKASRNLRVKTGCLICRRRRKKCDENKPSCHGCLRNGFGCQWPLETGEGTRWVQCQRAHTQTQTPLQHPESPCQGALDEVSRPSPPVSLPTAREKTISHASVLLPIQHDTVPTTVSPSQLAENPPRSYTPPRQIEPSMAPTPRNIDESLPLDRSPGQFSEIPGDRSASIGLCASESTSDPWTPGFDADSFHIINYYLQNTAVDLANGSTPDNPFLYQMIPLAFSSELMLSLIVAQGVAHGKEKGDTTVSSSYHYHYVKSLNSLQRYIGQYVAGDTNNLLELTAGVLAMCMIEATRGDTQGTCFDHVLAARSLIHDLLSRRDIRIPSSLKYFLLECYIYVAASSSLLSSGRHKSQAWISKEVAEAGQELINIRYIGNLSGCWLALLLLIPRVVDFRRQYITCIASKGEPSVDLMVMFAELHAELVQWTPDPAATPDVALAGNIYHQAVIVFLLSAVTNGKNRFLSGPLDMTLEKHISQGLEYLAKLPLSARLNTNLCWPITVLGSCLDDPHQQDIIRNRLISNRNLLGFRNIASTASILEHIWTCSEDERGPWKTPCVMDANQLWITFA
ncbi:hypothetical protein BO94DRAFT_512255 [Aspergillus sclerotioniger CBS 115572]|uniref:Zn(2)-C6 fungal-type domain-containing protein n=1 Tax=Aspergillus sclerotioniger CBS 115572 TaxID=1450535 RepID=A0A317X3T7_9EURO|nr:hypothetical protein BO94DRAFT_512255 [Aspergillus sclerotioniger CBS 115572]PWY93226.1 hypothetical protein BO94DRAFT_512255 [Aspergillus sclerotioniger CBS 115572]